MCELPGQSEVWWSGPKEAGMPKSQMLATEQHNSIHQKGTEHATIIGKSILAFQSEFLADAYLLGNIN